MDFLGAIMGWGQVQNNMVCLGKVPMPLPLCLLPKYYIQLSVLLVVLAPYMFICSIDFDFLEGGTKRRRSRKIFFKANGGLYTSADFVLKDVIHDYKVHLCRPKNISA